METKDEDDRDKTIESILINLSTHFAHERTTLIYFEDKGPGCVYPTLFIPVFDLEYNYL